jgi:ADP-ribose pyrophosphatase
MISYFASVNGYSKYKIEYWFFMKSELKLIESKVSGEQIFKGNLLDVRRDVARLPDGQMSVREWICHPGACAVVPLFDNGDVMLIRQFRYPAGQIFWEVPAGKIDPNEPPDITAVRELHEEVGLECTELHYIGHMYLCIGYSDEIIHIYGATGLHQDVAATDDDEFLEPVRMPLTEAIEMIHNGLINDAKTIVSLTRAAQWFKENGFLYV